MQIFHALGAIVGGLSGGVTEAVEDIAGRDICRIGQQIREELGLVEPALAFPGRMKRHRNDEIEMAAVQPRIVQSLAKPARYRMSQIGLFCVLKLVDEPANQTPASVGGNGAIEVEDAILAIGATKRLGDGAGKWLGAFGAEWRNDSGRALLAFTAQIFRPRYVRGANHAGCRVEERDRGGTDFRQRDAPHNPTTVSTG